MKQEDADYVRLRLARARETLAEAEWLVKGNHLAGAVNRIYYACFHAVNALLHTENLSASRHSGVISLFDRHWIAPGRLPVGTGRLYRRFFELRQAGDYEIAVRFDEADVNKWLSDAEEFLNQIEVWLRENKGIGR